MARTGRPTEYQEDYPQKTIDYVNRCLDTKEFPSIEWLCTQVLDCTEDTIANWSKDHEDFLGAVEFLKQVQRHVLQQYGLQNKWNSGMARFILSANHGMVERKDITSGGEKIIRAEVEYIDANKNSGDTGSSENN
jgi:hypothetical protein